MANDQTNPETFNAPDRQTWRNWLLDNHASSKGVWLVYYKKNSGRPSISYAEAVEEALCFGWIDSRPNTLDAISYKQLFSPRKPKSPWSKINKERVSKLTQAGLMTEAGLAKIELAKKDGSWNFYDNIEEIELPPELIQALEQNPKANDYFQAFSPSSKKVILWWIASARRPETRQKRIEETVRLASQNIKANHYFR